MRLLYISLVVFGGSLLAAAELLEFFAWRTLRMRTGNGDGMKAKLCLVFLVMGILIAMIGGHSEIYLAFPFVMAGWALSPSRSWNKRGAK